MSYQRLPQHPTQADFDQWAQALRQSIADCQWLEWLDSESAGRALFPYDPTYHKNQFHIHHDNMVFYAETRKDAAWHQFMMTS